MPEHLAAAQEPCAEWRGEDKSAEWLFIGIYATSQPLPDYPSRMIAPRGQGLGQCLALTHAQLILAE